MKIPDYENMTKSEREGYELAVDYGLTDGLEEMFKDIENRRKALSERKFKNEDSIDRC